MAKAHLKDGSSDTSMLGAIDRLNLMPRSANCRRLQKAFLMHYVIGYEPARSRALGSSIGCPSRRCTRFAKNFGDYYRENIGEGGRCRPGMGKKPTPGVFST